MACSVILAALTFLAFSVFSLLRLYRDISQLQVSGAEESVDRALDETVGEQQRQRQEEERKRQRLLDEESRRKRQIDAFQRWHEQKQRLEEDRLRAEKSLPKLFNATDDGRTVDGPRGGK